MPDETPDTPETEQNDEPNAGSPSDASAEAGSSPVADGQPAADADPSAAQPAAPVPDTESAPAGEDATEQAQPDAPQTSDEDASGADLEQEMAEALAADALAAAGLSDTDGTAAEEESAAVASDEGTTQDGKADGDEGEMLLSQEDLNSLLGVAADTEPDKKAKLVSGALSNGAAESSEQVSESPAGAASPPPSESPQGAALTEEEAALAAMMADAQPIDMPDLAGDQAASAARSSLELLDDVELDVKIELGRTEMYVEDVLRLGVGSVVELDKLAGDPVDIHINRRLVGRGEVLVLNDNFCVRINEILSPIPEKETSS